MKNEETIVTIAETTCGGNIYFYNCYDICMVPIGLVESIIAKFSQLMGIIKEKDIDSCIGVAIKNSESNLYTISVPKTDEKEKLVSSSRNSVYAVKVDSDSYCLGIEIQRKVNG